MCEAAAGWAVAAGIVASLTGSRVPRRTVVCGEVGVSGEVRAVGRPDARLKEAGKLGFTSAIAPKGRAAKESKADDIAINAISDVSQLIRDLESSSDGPIRILDADARR